MEDSSSARAHPFVLMEANTVHIDTVSIRGKVVLLQYCIHNKVRPTLEMKTIRGASLLTRSGRYTAIGKLEGGSGGACLYTVHFLASWAPIGRI